MLWITGLFTFGFGIFSMGFQLLGSRLLAPWFGSSIVVWAFLISTFLAAFSGGSITGGVIARRSARDRVRALGWIGTITTLGFAMTAGLGSLMLGWLDRWLLPIPLALTIACLALFLIPVCGLAAINPLLVQHLTERGADGGFASGFLYGTSTIGNIAGIMVTAFFLIPSLPLSGLLWLWTLLVAALATALTLWMRQAPVAS